MFWGSSPFGVCSNPSAGKLALLDHLQTYFYLQDWRVEKKKKRLPITDIYYWWNIYWYVIFLWEMLFSAVALTDIPGWLENLFNFDKSWVMCLLIRKCNKKTWYHKVCNVLTQLLLLEFLIVLWTCFNGSNCFDKYLILSM